MPRAWPHRALLLTALACGDAGLPAPLAHPAIDPWDAVRPAAGGEAHEAGRVAFASCASCHFADAGGRPDGSIPRLAGQRAAVITSKLARIADRSVTLPVMLPYARALADGERAAVAAWLAALPAPSAVGHGDGTAVPHGAERYTALCAGCHGARGEGRDSPPTPALCGQHHGYLVRRLAEVEGDARGDADPGMRAVLTATTPVDHDAIADHLSRLPCAHEASP